MRYEQRGPLPLLIGRVLNVCAGAGTIIEAGSGLEAPYQFGLQKRARSYVMIDAHQPYLDANQTRGPNVHKMCGRLPGVLRGLGDNTFDAAVCCDVIEHLVKPDAEELLRQLQRIARKGCVLTPLGLCEQDRDNYLMGADALQTHRSTWTVDSLAALGVKVEVFVDFIAPGEHALWATWGMP